MTTTGRVAVAQRNRGRHAAVVAVTAPEHAAKEGPEEKPDGHKGRGGGTDLGGIVGGWAGTSGGGNEGRWAPSVIFCIQCKYNG